MFPSFLLSLREGIEAALIIGILLGALKNFNRTHLSYVVWTGAGIAALLSLIVAFVLNAIGMSLEGTAEAIFEGTTMILAAALLTWMIFSMQNHAPFIKQNIEADVHRATRQKGGGRALFLVAFLAVMREGIELALFITAVNLTASPSQTLTGTVLGLATSVVLGWLLFASTIRLDLRRFFQVTSFLLILFAAGLLAYGVHEFNEVGIIPPVIEQVWDINFLLDEKSVLGQLLTSLFGYNGNPSLTEVIAYVGYFVVLWLALRQGRKMPRIAQENAG